MKEKKNQMMNVSNEDLAEYIRASSQAMTNIVDAIDVLNKRINTLEEEIIKLDRILGNVSLK